MEQILPPYLHGEPSPHPGVYDGHFSTFQRYRSMPFAIRRDFYKGGELSGLFRHVDFLALYAIRGGQGIHWIDNQSYSLIRGDVYLMPLGATHTFRHYSDLEYDVFFFQIGLFNADELAALREIPGFWRLFAGDDVDIDYRIHLTPEQWRGVDARIKVMRTEWGEKSRAAGLLLKHEFFHLLVTLARMLEKSSQTSVSRERKPDAGLAAALRFCEEHLDKPLSVPKLAARSFLSPGHFSELFLREVGMTPAAYVRHIRLEKARALLKESDIPVAEVAARCGFSNAALFSRAFRNGYACAPLQYRKQERQT